MAIWKRKDGSYVIRYYTQTSLGRRRVQETLGPVSYREASRTHEARREANRDGQIGRPLFVDLVTEYRTLHVPTLVPRWGRNVVSILENRLLPEFARRYVDTLRPLDIERYLRKRGAAGASPATINRDWAVFSGVLNRAVAWGLIDQSPIPPGSVRAQREPDARLVFFTKEEWQRFQAAFEDEGAWEKYREEKRRLGPVVAISGAKRARRYGGGLLPDSEASRALLVRHARALPVFKALLHTGSRMGEILDLRWDQVDLERRVIRIRQAKTHREKLMPISDGLLEVLRAQPRGIRRAHVFQRASGCPWLAGTLRKSFNVGKALAGLRPELTIHSLRHTHASWLAMAGVPIRTIQQLLGHTNYRTTEKYAHLAPDHLASAVEVIGQVEAAGEG